MTTAATDPWLPFGLGREAALRVFCLPYAGGGASNFLPWRLALPDYGVAPVQYPGHETHLDAECLRDFPAMTEALVAALAPYLDRPYALFGYSMGARLAVAMENRCHELGLPAPRLVLVGANRAPDDVARYEGVSRLPQAEFIKYVSRYGGVPDMILSDPEWSEMVFRVLRDDFAVVEGATVPQPCRCPLFAYAGRDDESATPAQMAGWTAFGAPGHPPREFDGGHFFMRTAPDFLVRLGADLGQHARFAEADHAA